MARTKKESTKKANSKKANVDEEIIDEEEVNSTVSKTEQEIDVLSRKLTKEQKEEVNRRMAELKARVDPNEKLTRKDMMEFVISAGEVKDLVKLYYQIQKTRIATGNEVRAETITAVLEGTDHTPFILARTEESLHKNEEEIAKFLKYYCERDRIGKWLLSIKGIGPVLAAGLLAYIDIGRCQTAGSIWRYGGITGNPEFDSKRRGQKMSYDPEFKTLLWKIGDSFIKSSGRDGAIYGQLYKEKKAFYEKKNEEGGFSERAKQILEEKNFKDKNSVTYKAYASGKLSDAHITAMARRFAVKIFISHLFEVWYEYYNGCKPPRPFVEVHLGHVHIMGAPNREIVFPDEEFFD